MCSPTKKLNIRMVNLDHLCRRFSIDNSDRKLHGALLDCQLLSEVYLELLGGRQTNLELEGPPRNEASPKDESKDKRNTIHPIQTSQEEIKQHKDFVTNLKGAIWHKIDY